MGKVRRFMVVSVVLRAIAWLFLGPNVPAHVIPGAHEFRAARAIPNVAEVHFLSDSTLVRHGAV